MTLVLSEESNLGSESERDITMWTIIIIIFILWLLGAFGGSVFSGFPKMGNGVHVLVVIALVLLILKLLGVI